MATLSDLRAHYSSHRQGHVFSGWDQLAENECGAFQSELESLDLQQLNEFYKKRNEPFAAQPGREYIDPLPVVGVAEVPPSSKTAGELALWNGEVAVLVVAGGQGTRLGFDKPKGLYPVGPVSEASLFQIHAEKVLALSWKYETEIPFLVMTSDATHTETVEFFHEEGFFGLAESQVKFFQQGTMPALDLATGKLLLEAPGKLFLSPNGHGGTLTALQDSGLLKELETSGIKHIFYFQVDNPLVKIADPAFVGQHIESRAEVSSKVVFKETPEEKVGVLALLDGRCGIIEYSDMPAEMLNERDEDGSLLFRAGNPAIHIFDLQFLKRVTTGPDRLAFHIAKKKVEHYDPVTATAVSPASENALKFELFVFDALPLADRWLAVQTLREEEFAPLKNADGADSPASARALMIAQAHRWLGLPAGAKPVEISPLYALNAEEARAKIAKGFKPKEPTYLGAQ